LAPQVWIPGPQSMLLLKILCMDNPRTEKRERELSMPKRLYHTAVKWNMLIRQHQMIDLF
jgi:hypothetical protein